MPIPLAKAIDVLKADCPEGQMLVGGLEPDLPCLIEMPGVRSERIAFVGPEGGVTEAEQGFFDRAGVKSVRLTLTTLRVETAALAFASILTAQRDVHS